MQERRLRRSALRGPSLDLLLASVAERHGLAELVLADADGLPLAASVAGEPAERLAAEGCRAIGRGGRSPSVRAFRYGGLDLLLCARADPDTSHDGLVEAERGVRRILGENT